MQGIAVLVPTFELFQLMDNVCVEHPNITLCKKMINQQVEIEAEEAVRDGAAVIVARGTQADRIRRIVNIPVVDIVWTAQEIGLTILRAKELLRDGCKSIGIVGMKSMFCDTTHFSELYGVDIQTFYYTSIEEKEQLLEEKEVAEIDVLIGAPDMVDRLRHLDKPVLPVISTEESMRIAVVQAESLFYASELERRNKAQVNSLLNSVFNGLIQIDMDGYVVMLNRVMEGMLNKGQEEILGNPIHRVLQELNQDLIDQVLHSPLESFSTFLNINGTAMVVILSPIVVDEKISGAYLSLKKIKKNDEINYVLQEEERRGSMIAYRTFGDIPYTSEKMAKMVEQAKLYSQSNTPLMIEGQSGDDRESICQGIHNYSLRKRGPYVSISMVGLSDERQIAVLFGNSEDGRSTRRTVGALEKANGGTLVINGIGFASISTQSALCRFIRENSGVILGNGDVKLLDVRIIVTSSTSLLEMRRSNTMTYTFYYIFSGLTLRIPPLQERREDIEHFVKLYMERYTQQYSRYHVLTKEAMDFLKSQEWHGSGLQIDRFIERMVLSIEKRTIKQYMVETLMQEMYPDELAEHSHLDGIGVGEKDAYEILLRNTLLKYSGNRNATAKELGISSTTLWRKMKKYGLTE